MKKYALIIISSVAFYCNAHASVNIYSAVALTPSVASGTCTITLTIGEPYSHANGNCTLEQGGSIKDQEQFSGYSLGYPISMGAEHFYWETLAVFISSGEVYCSVFDDVVHGHVTDPTLNHVFSSFVTDCCTVPGNGENEN